MAHRIGRGLRTFIGIAATVAIAALIACQNPDSEARQAAIARAESLRDSVIAAILSSQKAEGPYRAPIWIDRPTIAIFAPRPKTAGDTVPDLAIQAIDLAAEVDSMAAARGVTIVVRGTASLKFAAKGVIMIGPELDLPDGASGIVLAGPRKPLEIRMGLPSVEELIAAIKRLESLHYRGPREPRPI